MTDSFSTGGHFDAQGFLGYWRNAPREGAILESKCRSALQRE
jgi:hypothetical protein